MAARTELSIKTIRHYDDVGLVVPSERSAGGFRLYTTDDVARLTAIRRMKPLGFTLAEMREVLDALAVLDDGSSTVVARDRAAEALAQFHRRAADACATLTTQLGYARELTEQLARYRPDDTR
mgnify:CR=1 FL=1